MHDFRYSDAELSVLSELKGTAPTRIIGDGINQVVLDYGSYYVRAEPDDMAVPERVGGEAIRAVFTERDGDLVPLRQHFVIQSPVIKRVLLLRTVLCFTHFETYSPEQRASTLWYSSDPVLEQRLRDTGGTPYGGYEERLLPPDSPRVADSDHEAVALVDSGVLLDLGDQYFGIYARENFFTTDQKVYSQVEVSELVTPHYQLIEL